MNLRSQKGHYYMRLRRSIRILGVTPLKRVNPAGGVAASILPTQLTSDNQSGDPCAGARRRRAPQARRNQQTGATMDFIPQDLAVAETHVAVPSRSLCGCGKPADYTVFFIIAPIARLCGQCGISNEAEFDFRAVVRRLEAAHIEQETIADLRRTFAAILDRDPGEATRFAARLSICAKYVLDDEDDEATASNT
jgi:hypothetical protein